MKIALTRVSCLLRVSSPDSQGNHARSLRVGRAARFVHSSRPVVLTVVLAAVALAGCVIPPGLELVDEDAAVNAAPVIMDVRDEAGNPFERPGPRDIAIGQGRLVLTLQDPDIKDTLFVRYYVDYGLPLPTAAVIECEAGPGATPTLERQITCSLVGVCTGAATNKVFEIEVFDRPVTVDDQTRLYRKIDPPGLSTSWWWNINCVQGAR
jgi:hypothetical protein